MTVDSATFGQIREDLAPNKVIAGEVPIAWIRPSALNPRKHFDESALQELAASIKEHGIIEPIVVREIADPPIDEERLARGRKRLASFEKSVREDIEKARAEQGGWGWCRFTLLPREWEDVEELYRFVARELGLRIEDVRRADGSSGLWRFRVSRLSQPRYGIIAGERRYRAAQLAGLETVPCRKLDDIDDATALRLALIENLQRQDLDPIEEAEGYRQLNRVCGLKQTEIAAAVKRSQPVVANAMRLLELPEEVQDRIRRRELTPSHGVALAKYKDFPQIVRTLADLAVASRWTSADLEGENLLYHWQVRETGLVQYIGGAKFDFAATCIQACPFGAYRKPKEHGGSGYCLKPEHYRELQAAAEAEAKAKSEAAKAASVAAAKEPPPALPAPAAPEHDGPVPEGRPGWMRFPPDDRPPVWQKIWAGYVFRVAAVGDGTLCGYVTVLDALEPSQGPEGRFFKLVEAQLAVEQFAHEKLDAPAPVVTAEITTLPEPDSPMAGLPRLADMIDGKYERLDYSWNKPPEGCSEACACRGQAVDREGKVVPICTKPGRLTWLRGQVTKRETQARQKDANAKLKAMLGQVERLDDIAARPAELAILAAAALRKSEYTFVRRDDLRKAHVPELDQYARDPKDFMDVALSNPIGLVRYVVAAILGDELKTYHDQGGLHPWAKWYLQWHGLIETADTPEASAPVSPAVTSDDEPDDDDDAECCTKCHRKLSDAEIEVDEALCFDCMDDRDLIERGADEEED